MTAMSAQKIGSPASADIASEHISRVWASWKVLKGHRVEQLAKKGLDVELRNPRKKGMDIIETVQVQRY